MPRSTNAVAAKKKRDKVLKQAKGYWGRGSNVHTVAKNKVEKGLYVEFENMQSAITEGQFVAWYVGEELLGSGVIT